MKKIDDDLEAILLFATLGMLALFMMALTGI